MTFRVENGYDLTYSCPSGHEGDTHPIDLDSPTWTCRGCRQSVNIELATKHGHPYTVQRIPAREVQGGDYLVRRVNAGHQALQVYSSNADGHQAGRWDLRVAKHGKLSWPATQYVNCIRG